MDPPLQHCQSTEWSLHCSMLSLRWTQHCQLDCSWHWKTVTPKTLSEHRVISSLFNVVIQTQLQMNPLQTTVRTQSDLFTVQCCHWESQADGPPMCKTLSEHRVISSLFNVAIETQRQIEPLPGQHCQSSEWSLNCSMLSFRLNCRWTPCKPLSEHRVISSLFNVVIENHRQMDHLCVKHCQSTEWSLHCSMLSFRLNCRWTPCKPLSEHRVISSLCNVVIENHRQMDHLCVKHCQSTEWSLHCSMLSFRLKGRWTPLVNTVRAQSDLFTVQCCHSDSKADGLPP